MIVVVAAIVAAAASAKPALAPGETRCTSRRGFFGSVDTNCETGQAVQSSGWWCTARSTGGGYCWPEAGGCEAFRGQQSCANAGPGDCVAYSACAWQAVAICAEGYCFLDPASCGSFERGRGRDGGLCEAKR